jgi:hypothetical protein
LLVRYAENEGIDALSKKLSKYPAGILFLIDIGLRPHTAARAFNPQLAAFSEHGEAMI